MLWPRGLGSAILKRGCSESSEEEFEELLLDANLDFACLAFGLAAVRKNWLCRWLPAFALRFWRSSNLLRSALDTLVAANALDMAFIHRALAAALGLASTPALSAMVEESVDARLEEELLLLLLLLLLRWAGAGLRAASEASFFSSAAA